jgi:hypothetical protein
MEYDILEKSDFLAISLESARLSVYELNQIVHKTAIIVIVTISSTKVKPLIFFLIPSINKKLKK